MVEALRGKAIRQIGAGGSHSLAANFPFQTTTDMYRLLDDWQRHKEMVAAREREAASARDRQAKQQPIISTPPPSLQPPPPPPPIQPTPLPTPAQPVQRPPPRPSPIPEVKTAPSARGTAPSTVPLTPLNNLSPLAGRAEAFIDDLEPELSRSSALSGPVGPPKRVRVLYSDSVSLVHKFATFQSSLPYRQFESLLQGYIKRCYAVDPEIQFDDLIAARVCHLIRTLRPKSNGTL